MKISTENIVFSGSEGSIGSQRPSDSMIATSLLESSLEEKIEELQGLESKPLAFIHLAAMASVKRCEEDPELAYRLNVHGAVDWLKACQEVGVEKFIFASTSHVYAPEACDHNLTTESPVGPQKVYGQSKLRAEKLLIEQEKEATTQLYVARVFSVLADPGPEWSLMEGLKRRARERDFSPIPGLSCARDFLTNGEVCERLVKIALSEEKLPQILNVCSGKSLTVREIAEKVFRDRGLDIAEIKEAHGTDGTPKIIGVPTPLD